MKIFAPEHIKQADQITVQNQNISSLDLMERAGETVFNMMHERLQGAPVKIHIFCGLGNNGGDGLVIARHLEQHGYHVATYVVNFSNHRSKNFLANFDRIKEISKKWPVQLKNADELPEISPQDMVVDCIFGIGLNRPMVDWVEMLVKHTNQSRTFILSIDVPSGLYADKAPENKDAVIYCNVCLTFQAPKLVFFLPETAGYIQEVDIVDIGLDQNFMQQVQTQMELIQKPEVLSLYQPREKFSHKGIYGHALLIGGSRGKIGSMLLASKSCLVSGAGLVTAIVPKCGYDIMQCSIPEVMIIDNEHDDYLVDFASGIDAKVVCIGMGLGKKPQTIDAFKEFLVSNKKQLVIDADGLNILSENKNLLTLLPAQTVMTPHPKELERLIGSWKDDFDKLEKTKQFSKEYNCIIVIKGANTITVYKEDLYVNSTGNPGMATAGSGDVLSGIITGLISQNYVPLHAAIFGVYLHGSAGDIAIESTAYQALIASDITNNLGNAYLELFKEPEQNQNN